MRAGLRFGPGQFVQVEGEGATVGQVDGELAGGCTSLMGRSGASAPLAAAAVAVRRRLFQREPSHRCTGGRQDGHNHVPKEEVDHPTALPHRLRIKSAILLRT
ncbi:hypothetical protein SGA01_41910 [Streptomyces gardneri]|uniref:Uncharacterized protein n=1 Tax=Streptomyces gardneri TaxID=66892 RepID=A0A4Y3RLH3_9ACTN|nr:hypothetical protein SGA01_41910 [Streptomyces gardneri]